MINSLQQLFEEPHPVILVTGSGAPRVGNAVIEAFAKLGCRSVVHAHRSVDQAQETADRLSEFGGESMALTADLTQEEEVRQLFDKIHKRFGRIDVLVNCAAIWSKKRLEKITADDVRRDFEVNTLGTFLCCQHAGLRMVEQECGGAIVNIGDWAIVRPYVDHAAYFPSKGAIPTMTRMFAVEFGERNPKVRVNAILPGPVMMPADMSVEERQPAIDATLAKREGGGDSIASAALFLVQNEFVTGVCLPVDGGRTIHG